MTLTEKEQKRLDEDKSYYKSTLKTEAEKKKFAQTLLQRDKEERRLNALALTGGIPVLLGGGLYNIIDQSF